MEWSSEVHALNRVYQAFDIRRESTGKRTASLIRRKACKGAHDSICLILQIA